MPSSNQDYWVPKINANKERDERNQKLLLELGWNVIVVWECELKNNTLDITMRGIISKLLSNNT